MQAWSSLNFGCPHMVGCNSAPCDSQCTLLQLQLWQSYITFPLCQHKDGRLIRSHDALNIASLRPSQGSV